LHVNLNRPPGVAILATVGLLGGLLAVTVSAPVFAADPSGCLVLSMTQGLSQAAGTPTTAGCSGGYRAGQWVSSAPAAASVSSQGSGGYRAGQWVSSAPAAASVSSQGSGGYRAGQWVP
jgi:hypothetical protein